MNKRYFQPIYKSKASEVSKHKKILFQLNAILLTNNKILIHVSIHPHIL